MKRSFNHTKLAVAMASVLGAAPAFAVNLSDNGLGDVGMVPYYTVRNNIDTNISVVNTSLDYVVAFKIRFREGDNTRDARDFNVFLSPGDVWVATVTRMPDGDDDPNNDVPVLVTTDTSCTAPILEPVPELGDRPGIEFTNIAYTGGSRAPKDDGSQSIVRAQEGHFEVIEMGVADPEVSTLAGYAVHAANGPPANCAAITQVYLASRNVPASGVCGVVPAGTPIGRDNTPAPGNDAFKEEYCEPLNVLKVSANLIRVDKGVAGGMPVDMLANFYNPNGGVEDYLNPDPRDLMERPEDEVPNLASVDPAVSVQITERGPLGVGFPRAIDAVSSLFTSTDVINEYAIGGAGLAQNAWVVTFPTKNFYVDNYLNAGPPDPFEFKFQGDADGPGVSCVTVDFGYFDREENTPLAPPRGLEPSPPPVTVIPEDSICQETQTLNFGDESLLGSKNNYLVPLEDGFTSGWMRLRFAKAGSITGVDVNTNQNVIFDGLAVQGFSIKSLENGVAAENLLNYGIISEHAYLRSIR